MIQKPAFQTLDMTFIGVLQHFQDTQILRVGVVKYALGSIPFLAILGL